MSVLKNLRNLSKMEFYKNAIELRKEITFWMLRDFGTVKNKKNIQNVIKDISDEDKKIVDDIFLKYGKNLNHEFQSEYPSWFVNYERQTIYRIMQEMIENITRANSLYVTKGNIAEYEARRLYQDKAIGCCYVLYQELQYIELIFRADINKMIPTLEKIEKEVDLLKGWRQSDNKLKGIN